MRPLRVAWFVLVMVEPLVTTVSGFLHPLLLDAVEQYAP
jgi:hypothetical protein